LARGCPLAANQLCNSGALADSVQNGRPIETANRPNSQSAIPLDGGARHPAAIAIGSDMAVAPINNKWNSAARRGDNNRPRTCA
jgi:hypothetical protein